MSNKTGLLLINLGTPDSPSKSDVRCYLNQFLSDPRVIDIPFIARWILLNFIILPFRSKRSAKAYEKIWTPEGSPLLVNSLAFMHALQAEVGEKASVALGMRYGSPSIQSAVDELKLNHCDEIIIVPLFPQYSSAATGSALDAVMHICAQGNTIPSLRIHSDFYQQDFFINAQALVIEQALKEFNADHLLFSYHGLPERHIDKSGCKKNLCDRIDTCPMVTEKNRFCYRAQCYATTSAIVNKLQFDKTKSSTAFQSRLGRTPWIKPYTDEVLPQLAERGIKRLAITCPAFVADCLETLEEIGIRAKEQWLALGGEELLLIPCLNDNAAWVKGVANYLLTQPLNLKNIVNKHVAFANTQ